MTKLFLSMVCVVFVSLYAGEMKVAVAANANDVVKALIKSFKQHHPHTHIEVILGSSGKLTAQIMHGAPFDLFLSANMDYPNRLYRVKKAITKPIVYAEGALAIFSRKKRDFCAEIFVLKDRDIQKIAIGNPKTAPYGAAAIDALRNARIYDKIKDKLVYGESISQTLGYVMGAADIGIVAKSSLYAPSMSLYKEAIHWTELDETLYTPIKQGMVLLEHAQDNIEAKAFYDFVKSTEAKQILKSYGYKI